MIKIKLDENLGTKGKEILKTNGFDVFTVYDEGYCSTSDKDLIEICRKERRCLVTMDLDFANPLVFKPSKYHGIAVLRLRSKPTPNDMFNCIKVLAEKLKTQNIKGKLWIIQKKIIREYQEEE